MRKHQIDEREREIEKGRDWGNMKKILREKRQMKSLSSVHLDSLCWLFLAGPE